MLCPACEGPLDPKNRTCVHGHTIQPGERLIPIPVEALKGNPMRFLSNAGAFTEHDIEDHELTDPSTCICGAWSDECPGPDMPPKGVEVLTDNGIIYFLATWDGTNWRDAIDGDIMVGFEPKRWWNLPELHVKA